MTTLANVPVHEDPRVQPGAYVSFHDTHLFEVLSVGDDVLLENCRTLYKLRLTFDRMADYELVRAAPSAPDYPPAA